MKARMGFVSNSSSASFIVHWRVKTLGQECSVKGAMAKLFDLWNFDYSNDAFVWKEESWDSRWKEKAEALAEAKAAKIKIEADAKAAEQAVVVPAVK